MDAVFFYVRLYSHAVIDTYLPYKNDIILKATGSEHFLYKKNSRWYAVK